MIKKWRLQNFKSVYGKTELEMSPLTVFAGANSSGKSTFIQSILLVAQTLTNQVYSRPVILNGHIARLGSFDDLASSGSDCEEIDIGFTLAPRYEYHDARGELQRMRFRRNRMFRRKSANLEAVECDFSFSATDDSVDSKILQLQPRLTYCQVSAKEADEEQAAVVEVVRAGKHPMKVGGVYSVAFKDDRSTILSSLKYRVTVPKKYPLQGEMRYTFEEPQKGELVGCSFSHFLPVSFTLLYDSVEDHALQLFEVFRRARLQGRSIEFNSDDEPFLNEEFLSKLCEVVSAYVYGTPEDGKLRRAKSIIERMGGNLDASELLKACRVIEPPDLYELIGKYKSELVKRAIGDKEPEKAVTAVSLPAEIYEGRETIRHLFSDLFKYLGPLRDEPKAVYPVQGAVDPGDVGLRGEFTAGVLDLYKNEEVKYIPAACFVETGTNLQEKTAGLHVAVLDWLQYMGVVEQVQTRDLGTYGHELKVGTDAAESLHNLMHVGVGVSQVLPILVMSILSEANSVLVFEQPEIHLHPKVQSRLGDFLLSMALLGKQCIVETHSEYLINRLRYRAAADKDNSIADTMRLYFVEKREGKSTYRKVEINEYGAIVDWPIGFFDQSQGDSEQILRAAMEKKRRVRREEE